MTTSASVKLAQKPNLRKRVFKKLGLLVVALGITYVVLAIVSGIVLAEFSLHIPRRITNNRGDFAKTVQQEFDGALREVSITAKDGIVLRGWLAIPKDTNGKALILLHGLGDNRDGMTDIAELGLENGYTLLMPDSRAHGESGGAIPSYGILEVDDVHKWVSWLEAQGHFSCLYGLGRSMGAGILLQSLGVEHRFCAVVADSPFSSFKAIAAERAAHLIGLRPTSRIFAGFPMTVATTYVRLRYGLNLFNANPAEAVHMSGTPVLLIHGADDQEILPRHSEYIAQHNPNHVQLWIVPNAKHLESLDVAPEEFKARVLAWFAEHDKAPDAMP